MPRTLSTAEQLRAEAERLLARAGEIEGMGDREAIVAAAAEQARKGCRHVGACNCGQPCGCGRPGCVIPLNKRRHARYRNNACKQFAFEQRHPTDVMTQTQMVAAGESFWGGVGHGGRPQLGDRRGRAAKPSEPPVEQPATAAAPEMTLSRTRPSLGGRSRKRREPSANGSGGQ